MIETITHNGIVMAIIIRAEHSKEGIEFFTPEDFSQQLGYMKRPAGYRIPPHMHRHAERTITYTQEVLYVKSGLVQVNFFDGNRQSLESRRLRRGDVILLANGGHGFDILEAAEMIEIKQGPYNGAEDKITFAGEAATTRTA